MQRAVGLGSSFVPPIAFFLFGSVRYVKPHPIAEQNHCFCCSPHLLMALRSGDGPSPLVMLAAQQPCGLYRALGQLLVLGCCQEPFGMSVFLKQLCLSAWDWQQLVGLFGKPCEKAVGSAGTMEVCLWPPKPSSSPSPQQLGPLLRHLPQMGPELAETSHGLVWAARPPVGPSGYWPPSWHWTVSHGWVNWLRVPCMLYLKIEKGSCTRPFLFFATLVFHRGKYRREKIFHTCFKNSVLCFLWTIYCQIWDASIKPCGCI